MKKGKFINFEIMCQVSQRRNELFKVQWKADIFFNCRIDCRTTETDVCFALIKLYFIYLLYGLDF